MDIVSLILTKDLDEAKTGIHATLNKLVEEKITSLKKKIAESVYGPITEANVMKQGRTLLIRRRIRKGKLQRNVRKSAIKGFTLRGGKIKRIPVAQRIRARITQRRAARLRRAHMQQSLRKRKLSLRKRKAMGIRENAMVSHNTQTRMKSRFGNLDDVNTQDNLVNQRNIKENLVFLNMKD